MSERIIPAVVDGLRLYAEPFACSPAVAPVENLSLIHHQRTQQSVLPNVLDEGIEFRALNCRKDFTDWMRLHR
jgi:hypothetical protein